MVYTWYISISPTDVVSVKIPLDCKAGKRAGQRVQYFYCFVSTFRSHDLHQELTELIPDEDHVIN